MTGRTPLLAAVLAAAGSVQIGCGDKVPTGPDYDPDIPAQWAAAVTNPFFPLVAGTARRYESETMDGLETIAVEVLADEKAVNGVAVTVVLDRVFLDGELIEETFDWYAQDADGNVWYLGEDSKEIEGGQVVSTAGSWEWGVDGALPGIIMWADPAARLGEEYRQEFYAGEAEDWGKVVGLDESASVPFGDFSGCIRTEDWSGLDPATREHKTYCPDVGVVLEVVVGGDERVELVEVTGP